MSGEIRLFAPVGVGVIFVGVLIARAYLGAV